jgi:predicted RNase H-like HicB family nuclease
VGKHLKTAGLKEEREVMNYAFATEPGTATSAWGTVVADLPGCSSAGDTLDEALQNTQEAAQAWIDAVIEDRQAIRRPR